MPRFGQVKRLVMGWRHGRRRAIALAKQTGWTNPPEKGTPKQLRALKIERHDFGDWNCVLRPREESS